MDTSQLSNIQDEYRSCPYQGRYRYKAEFNLPGARKTAWNRDMDDFRIAVWRAKTEAESYNYLNRARRELEWINAIDYEHIEHFLRVREEFIRNRNSGKSISVKVNHCSDTVRVLSDDPQYFSPLIYDGFRDLKIYRSLHDGNREVMWFNTKPKTKYRLYLKARRVDKEIKEHLNYIIQTGDDLYPSDALKWWLNSPNSRPISYNYYWVSSNFNIGFNHEATYTLLQLSLDNSIVGKYYELRCRGE